MRTPEYSVNLKTLAWLDRRRLWATPNRSSALGVSPSRTHPTTLGGQGTRPGLAHRHFTPALSWLAITASALSAMALALAAVCAVTRGLLELGFRGALLKLDSTLSPSGSGERTPPHPAWGTFSNEALSTPVAFARLVYATVGSLDATSSYTPATKVTCPHPGLLGWEPCPLPSPLNGSALSLTTQSAGMPSFRAYLGEWRRLADQSSPSPTTRSVQGCTQTRRSSHRTLGATPVGGVKRQGYPGTAGSRALNKNPAYSLYLSTPWVF